MIGFLFVITLVGIAMFAPAIAGTKPVICRYKGRLYVPCLAYFDRRLEPAIFSTDKFRGTYPANLTQKDPASWAIWPLVFQDPYRAVCDYIAGMTDRYAIREHKRIYDINELA